jgi:hypothetical protein
MTVHALPYRPSEIGFEPSLRRSMDVARFVYIYIVMGIRAGEDGPI